MNYNPYTSQIRELENHIATMEAALDSQKEQLTWHRSFEGITTAQEILEETIIEEKYAVRARETYAKIQDTKRQIIEIKKSSTLGWSPANWPSPTEWSSSRKGRKERLKQCEILKKQNRSYIAEKSRIRESIDTKKELLHRYASFDIIAATIENSSLQEEIETLREELLSLKTRESSVDLQIDTPVKKLQEVEREIQDLESQIAMAQSMDAKLSRASNSYERKLVHKESQSKFDDATPSRVADRVTSQLVAKRRDQKKLQNRITTIIQRESQDVRSLIIDGSNLCYEGDKLIGLSPLRELCKKLPKEINVEVIFDGSILEKLGVPNERSLHAYFPDIPIHLVYDRAGADETILEAAVDQTTYVISGDRFVDYPEKAAVRENRVLKPQIINKRVLITRLGINFEY